jgi:hypothetical protein
VFEFKPSVFSRIGLQLSGNRNATIFIGTFRAGEKRTASDKPEVD